MQDSKFLPVEAVFEKFRNKKILKLNDNLNRNEAKLYTNHELYLDRSVLIPANLDEYYHIDLIGLKVYDVKKKFIGVVEEITNNNNLDHLKVNLKNDFLFIPFTKKNIKKIEMRSKRLFLN